jgi:predicted phage terminase large subunit-like protein
MHHDLLKKLKNVATRKGIIKPDWNECARESQKLPIEPWNIWLIMAGRGFGKTRTGAESIKQLVETHGYKRIALIGASLVQARSIMIEGQSGLLSCYSISKKPRLAMTQRKILWKNGAEGMIFGGDQFEQLRGPQFDAVWIDELAKFRYPEHLFEQVQLCLRLGKSPKCIITTTPKPLPILEKLKSKEGVVMTNGTTFENKTNLSAHFIEQIAKEFQGTRLGSQELYGELLTERDGALWQRSAIHYKTPPETKDNAYDLKRIVVAIDPATTCHNHSDETGIVVAGLCENRKAYILDDLSGKLSPLEWGQRAVNAYHHYKADRILAEVNKGGDLVERVIQSIDATASFKEVKATRGKATRAEPVAALYEKGNIFHVRPFHKLEEQLCCFVPGVTSKSPDRLDALVWAITDLMLTDQAQAKLKIWGIQE